MTVQYVRPDGSYVGGFGDGALPSERDAYPAAVEDLVNIGEDSPEYADQIYLFPGWAPSRLKQELNEQLWRVQTLVIIARQLEAIEEDEADETPSDLLPGTRKQWLKYRGQVSNWNETSADFPDSSKRPVAPT